MVQSPWRYLPTTRDIYEPTVYLCGKSGRNCQWADHLGSALLYVRLTATAQRLELGSLAPGGRDRVLYRLGAAARRDPGYEPGHSHVTRTPQPKLAPGVLWTTALAPQFAYVTFIRRKNRAASIVSIRR